MAVMRLLVGVFLLALSPGVWAGTIFDNGAPITDPNSDCSPSCPELTSSVGSGVFSLSANSTVTGVQFWTFQLAGVYNSGTLNWQIVADDSGSPGLQIGAGTFTLSQSFVEDDISVAGYGPLTEYVNDFTIGNLAIDPPPQNYFLDISDTSGVDDFGIFWATSGPGALAFQIDGTSNIPPNQVPEPATVLLFASGCAWIVARQGTGHLAASCRRLLVKSKINSHSR